MRSRLMGAGVAGVGEKPAPTKARTGSGEPGGSPHDGGANGAANDWQPPPPPPPPPPPEAEVGERAGEDEEEPGEACSSQAASCSAAAGSSLAGPGKCTRAWFHALSESYSSTCEMQESPFRSWKPR
eukprot:COSAG01_NODE_394_length_17660_cov_5.141954_9_plen_127_part_00